MSGGLSYPSGHATTSFALATVSIILLAAPSWPRVPAITRRLLMLGALLLAVAVASAVVGLNLHYFTDIVGGAALGTGTAVLTALLLDIVCGSEWWRARTARPSPGRLTPGPGAVQSCSTAKSHVMLPVRRLSIRCPAISLTVGATRVIVSRNMQQRSR